jgi:hypothetical protein
VVLIRWRERRPDDGAVAVLVAVVVVAVILPLLAVVVDLGLSRTLSVRFRGAADAAALAAAAAASSGADAATAAMAARSLVATNLSAPDGGWGAAWESCVDPDPLPDGTDPSPGDCISFDYPLKQVRVTVPGRAIPDVFAGVTGRSTPDASATSAATWGDRISPAVGSCVLCVLGTYTSGAEYVRVSGGDAAADVLRVTWPGRLQVSGGGVTFATSWRSTGGYIWPLPVKRPVQDYFAASLTTMQASVPYGQASNPGPTGDCSPGVYQTVSGCISFAPGAYYVTGNPTSNQQASLKADANNVLLFFTCSAASGGTVVAARCPSGVPPQFNGAAGGSRTLSAPGGTGFALVFDQGLAQSEVLDSDHQLTVVGDVYGPNVTLQPGGRSLSAVRGRVIVRALTGNLTYPFRTMLQVDAPPITSTGLTDGPVRLVRSG